MANEEVYMDVPAVRDMAKKFGEISDVLTNVAKALEALSNTLKATAFIGLVGGYAVIAMIDKVKPYIEKIAQKCSELNGDVSASADAYERGDAIGSARFH